MTLQQRGTQCGGRKGGYTTAGEVAAQAEHCGRLLVFAQPGCAINCTAAACTAHQVGMQACYVLLMLLLLVSPMMPPMMEWVVLTGSSQ
jgi:hypothetical protein